MLITIYVLKAFSYTIVIMWIEHAVITLKVKNKFYLHYNTSKVSNSGFHRKSVCCVSMIPSLLIKADLTSIEIARTNQAEITRVEVEFPMLSRRSYSR